MSGIDTKCEPTNSASMYLWLLERYYGRAKRRINIWIWTGIQEHLGVYKCALCSGMPAFGVFYSLFYVSLGRGLAHHSFDR